MSGTKGNQIGPDGQLRQVAGVVRENSLKKELEDDDPYEPVFMQFPPLPGVDAIGDMAKCMVEEYAMMGFSAHMLLKMFKTPFYQALNQVYLLRGEEYVQTLLSTVFGKDSSQEFASQEEAKNA